MKSFDQLDKKIKWEKYYSIINRVAWNNISIYENLTEEFMEEFQDRINWFNICQYQVLSEEFIERFSHKVYWPHIFKYQKVSNAFKSKYKYKLKEYLFFETRDLIF